MPAIDFSAVKGLEPLPVGQYLCTIKAATETESKAHNPMINIQWEVNTEGPFKGRIVFDQLTFAEKTMFRVKNTLLGLGFPKGYKGNIGPADLIGKTAILILDIDASTQINEETGEPYEPRNRVKKVKSVSSGAPVKAAPTAPSKK